MSSEGPTFLRTESHHSTLSRTESHHGIFARTESHHGLDEDEHVLQLLQAAFGSGDSDAFSEAIDATRQRLAGRRREHALLLSSGIQRMAELRKLAARNSELEKQSRDDASARGSSPRLSGVANGIEVGCQAGDSVDAAARRRSPHANQPEGSVVPPLQLPSASGGTNPPSGPSGSAVFVQSSLASRSLHSRESSVPLPDYQGLGESASQVGGGYAGGEESAVQSVSGGLPQRRSGGSAGSSLPRTAGHRGIAGPLKRPTRTSTSTAGRAHHSRQGPAPTFAARMQDVTEAYGSHLAVAGGCVLSTVLLLKLAR